MRSRVREALPSRAPGTAPPAPPRPFPASSALLLGRALRTRGEGAPGLPPRRDGDRYLCVRVYQWC